MKPIIKIENLSKQYRLGTIGTGTVKKDLQRWWAQVRGKEDPFLKIGDTNDRSTKGNSEFVWALRNINLEVFPGEVLGIIGKNGAGKSTLLKILSKVTGPTTGKIHFNGRIGSLLEVGTGFHPELTGRDNIFLNGAILGMTKAEIRCKMDEIVDFSGCERYIDTPVKRYSSGMTVRLGFAVAAHLEPEILVVDEVLAVGDAEFQKKAIGKIQDVSQNHGRTVLFVSHNMASIVRLCTNTIILNNGMLEKMLPPEAAVSYYTNQMNSETGGYVASQAANQVQVSVLSARLINDEGMESYSIGMGKNWKIEIQIQVPVDTDSVIVGIGVETALHTSIRRCWTDPIFYKEGVYTVTLYEDHIWYLPGVYHITIGISSKKIVLDYIEGALSFEITEYSDKVELITTHNAIIANPMKFTSVKC